MRGCLFDLDGVLTQTAAVHAAAWKEMFDHYLQSNPGPQGFRPFDKVRDYDLYVDGRPRPDGVRTFLASRGITLPEGKPDDPPDAPTVHGLGNWKNEILLRKLDQEGVKVYEGSVKYVRQVKEAGVPCAVVSSSANTQAVLKAAGIEELFDARVDGNDIEQKHLKGKPAPDSFIAGAKAIGLGVDAAAVFEDALAGVEAGRAGHFAFVVGVDRIGQAEDLKRHGADVVVKDLSELLGH